MKRWMSGALALAMLCAGTVCAEAASVHWHEGKTYHLQVRSIDAVYSLDGSFKALDTMRTTERLEDVSAIPFAYDYEQEQPDVVGRFDPDARIALVCVDGFSPELARIEEADRVAITVNGTELAADETADFFGHVGWQNVAHDGGYGVIFPIELTPEGGSAVYTVRVSALLEQDGRECEVIETARIRVTLDNERAFKAERAATISNIRGTHVDGYFVNNRIYLDYPQEQYTWYNEMISGVRGGEPPELEIAFADEHGAPLQGVVWAAQTRSKADKSDGSVLYLEQEGKLQDGGKAVFRIRSNSTPDQRQELIFTLETENARYQTQPFTVVERRDIEQRDPKGIYFAKSEHTLTVGQRFDPVVLGVIDGEPVRSSGTSALHIDLGPNTDRTVLDIADEGEVLACQPGVAYITARYETDQFDQDNVGNLTRVTYGAPSMKITVLPEAESAPENIAQNRAWTVNCSQLNVRAQPREDSPAIDRLLRGTALDVARVENGWATLRGGGFVRVEYLTWK